MNKFIVFTFYFENKLGQKFDISSFLFSPIMVENGTGNFRDLFVENITEKIKTTLKENCHFC